MCFQSWFSWIYRFFKYPVQRYLEYKYEIESEFRMFGNFVVRFCRKIVTGCVMEKLL